MDSGNVNSIISAVSGLAGVGAGAFLSYLKDRRVEKIKDARDSSYLAVLVVSHLDRFANGCVYVAFDDGTAYGRPAGENGVHKATVKPPKFSPWDLQVEWKVLPRDLMYDILQIPHRQEHLENALDGRFEFDDPPDYADYFWSRRREYAELVLHVSRVAKQLRKFAEMPIQAGNPGDWNCEVAMREVIDNVDRERAAYERRQAEAWTAVGPPPSASYQNKTRDQVEPLDTLALEVGCSLNALVDRTRGGELLQSIRGVRHKFAQELGFLVAVAHLRENVELHPGGYRIVLKGVEIGAGEVFPDMLMAINSGQVSGNLQGQPTTDPAFGLPAVWIQPSQRDAALAMDYTVVDPSTIIATHLHHLLQSHAAELLGREEVEGLLSHLSERSPKLVEDLVPKLLSADRLRKVLQNLLAEGVPIRDMRTIAEVLAEHAQQITDTDELTARVRQALGSFIVQSLSGTSRELAAAVLAPQLEQILLGNLRADPALAAVEPVLAQRLMDHAREMMQGMESQGASPVLLTVEPLRQFLARLLARCAPRLRVLSCSEIPDQTKVKITAFLEG